MRLADIPTTFEESKTIMKNLSTTLLVAMVGWVVNTYGQSELSKFAPNPDKVKVKLDMPLEGRAYKNGTGYSLNPKMLDELPKKVALVSFYTFDPGFTRTWSINLSSSSTHGYVTTRTSKSISSTKKRNSKGDAGPIAVGFYYSAIDILKTKFKEMGMDLLEPEEFLDTEEKRDFYANYEIEKSRFNDFMSNVFNSGKDQNTIYAYPEGYRVIPIDAEPFANYYSKGITSPMGYKMDVADGQLWVMEKIGKEVTSINELTNALGVDAVVFFYSTIYVPKETEIYLQNTNLLMFGPNPTSLPEGKSKKFNYFPGQMYIGARAKIGVPIKKVNKKKPETDKVDITGYGNIVEAMTNRMKEYFDKTYGKKK